MTKLKEVSIKVCLFFFIGIFVTSCNKNEEFENYDLLVSSEWKLVNVPALEPAPDETICAFEEILIFEDESNFRFDLICGTNRHESTTWKLEQNFTRLKLKHEFAGDEGAVKSTISWDITELNENTLILNRNTDESDDDLIFIETMEFERQ